MSKIQEQTEWYADMLDSIKQVANESSDLDHEERDILSMAYNNRLTSYRTSLRILDAI